jgi:hypothetical protein
MGFVIFSTFHLPQRGNRGRKSKGAFGIFAERGTDKPRTAEGEHGADPPFAFPPPITARHLNFISFFNFLL